MTNCEKTDNVCNIKVLKSLIYKELSNNKGRTDDSIEKLAKNTDNSHTHTKKWFLTM